MLLFYKKTMRNDTKGLSTFYIGPIGRPTGSLLSNKLNRPLHEIPLIKLRGISCKFSGLLVLRSPSLRKMDFRHFNVLAVDKVAEMKPCTIRIPMTQ